MRTAKRQKRKWLFVLQLSVKDASQQNYALSRDSSWNHVCNIIGGLDKNGPDIDATIAVPFPDQIADQHTNFRNLATAALSQSVSFQPMQYAPSVLTSRVHFDTQSFQALLNSADFDLIWLSEPAHVLGVKSILLATGQLNTTKIITAINWIDTVAHPKIDPRCSYFFRQVDGVYHSDAAIFNSHAAIALFEENLRIFFNQDFIRALILKAHAVPPAFDSQIITGKRPPTPRNAVPILIFNHRLHEVDFYRSNWARVFNICRSIMKTGLHFRVIATDIPTPEIRREYPFVEFRQLDYPEYVSLLHQSDIAAGLFQRPGMWSMSLVETMAAGCATVVPKHSGYLEMVSADYAGFSNGTLEGDRILISELLTNQLFRRTVADQANKYVHGHFSNSKLSQRILEISNSISAS